MNPLLIMTLPMMNNFPLITRTGGTNCSPAARMPEILFAVQQFPRYGLICNGKSIVRQER
jgi:hypothetical protein